MTSTVVERASSAQTENRGAPEPALAAAFESFARASASLESAYAALRRRVEDLSERLRETEERLQRSVAENLKLQESASRRSRLEAMGRMAAEIAHEIRNPLGGLELTACLLRDELAEEPERRDLALSILEGIRALTRVTGNLLNFTRSVTPRAERLDARVLLEKARALVAPACAVRGVQLEVVPAEAAGFRADPELCSQILLNCVQNALEAMPRGGTLRLRAYPVEDGGVTFEVEDSGRGMDAETLSRVFDPFFTTKERGTGLGLSISFRLAEAMGARLELRSLPGRGTTASLAFPAVEIPEPAR